MKKDYPLRMCKELHSAVEKLAKEEDRSVNYMLCKLIEKGLESGKDNNLNAIYLDDKTVKDIKELANKCNRSVEEVIKGFVEAYRSTYK